jgi:hypothetical protein
VYPYVPHFSHSTCHETSFWEHAQAPSLQLAAAATPAWLPITAPWTHKCSYSMKNVAYFFLSYSIYGPRLCSCSTWTFSELMCSLFLPSSNVDSTRSRHFNFPLGKSLESWSLGPHDARLEPRRRVKDLSTSHFLTVWASCFEIVPDPDDPDVRWVMMSYLRDCWTGFFGWQTFRVFRGPGQPRRSDAVDGRWPIC